MRNILGIGVLISGVIGGVAYMPQIKHLLKIKDSRSISITTWWLWLIIQVPILSYLFYIKDFYLIILQCLNALFILMVLILSIKYRKNANTA